MTTTKNLVLTHIEDVAAQAAAINSALNIIDAVAQGNAINETNTPPGSPAEGDVYIVGTSPTGAWAGEAGKIAVYLTGWVFLTPKEGWRFWEQTAEFERHYNGTVWTDKGVASAVTTLSMSVGTGDDTIADVGVSFNQTTLNNNFRDVGEKINEIIVALQNATPPLMGN